MVGIYQGSPTSTPREVAILYAIGDIPVFPCLPNKRPAVSGGFKSASVNSQQVAKWFDDDSYLIGVPTSGYIVVDLDRHNEEADGVKAWYEIVKEHDPQGEWKKTMMVRTPSGGVHIWFNDPSWPEDPHRNTASRLAPGIDTRADGGYVIIPPSCTADGPYVRIDEAESMLPAPPWLLSLLKPEPNEPQVPPRPLPEPGSGSASRYASAALKGEIKALSQAPKGTRNHSLNKAAFSLGQLVGGGMLDEDEVVAQLRAAAYGIGLEEEEVDITLNSGLSAGKASPRGKPDE